MTGGAKDRGVGTPGAETGGLQGALRGPRGVRGGRSASARCAPPPGGLRAPGQERPRPFPGMAPPLPGPAPVAPPDHAPHASRPLPRQPRPLTALFSFRPASPTSARSSELGFARQPRDSLPHPPASPWASVLGGKPSERAADAAVGARPRFRAERAGTGAQPLARGPGGAPGGGTGPSVRAGGGSAQRRVAGLKGPPLSPAPHPPVGPADRRAAPVLGASRGAPGRGSTSWGAGRCPPRPGASHASGQLCGGGRPRELEVCAA